MNGPKGQETELPQMVHCYLFGYLPLAVHAVPVIQSARMQARAAAVCLPERRRTSGLHRMHRVGTVCKNARVRMVFPHVPLYNGWQNIRVLHWQLHAQAEERMIK